MEAVKIKIIFAPHGKAPRHRKISDNGALQKISDNGALHILNLVSAEDFKL